LKLFGIFPQYRISTSKFPGDVVLSLNFAIYCEKGNIRGTPTQTSINAPATCTSRTKLDECFTCAHSVSVTFPYTPRISAIYAHYAHCFLLRTTIVENVIETENGNRNSNNCNQHLSETNFNFNTPETFGDFHFCPFGCISRGNILVAPYVYVRGTRFSTQRPRHFTCTFHTKLHECFNYPHSVSYLFPHTPHFTPTVPVRITISAETGKKLKLKRNYIITSDTKCNFNLETFWRIFQELKLHIVDLVLTWNFASSRKLTFAFSVASQGKHNLPLTSHFPHETRRRFHPVHTSFLRFTTVSITPTHHIHALFPS